MSLEVIGYKESLKRIKEKIKDKKAEKRIDEILYLIEKANFIEEIIRNPALHVALLGQVGVGKSSIISSLLPKIKLTKEELFEKKERISTDKFIKKSALLPIGDGRTTLANFEIRLRQEAIFNVKVEMFDEEEIREKINYLVEYYLLPSEERRNYPLMPSELRTYFYNKVIKRFVELRTYKKFKTKPEYEKEFIRILKDNKDFLDEIKEEIFNLLTEKSTGKNVLSIFYREKDFEKLFKGKYKNEDLKNKELRFFKKILKMINKGKLKNVTIPKKIIVTIPHYQNITFYDIKGFEKYNNNKVERDSYYINEEIERLANDDGVVTLFISALEDAPSYDIKEIFSQKSLKDRFKYKSGLIVSLKKEIDKEEYEKKRSDCILEIEELGEDKIGFYNAYKNFLNDTPMMEFSNETFYDFLDKINSERIIYLEKERQEILSLIKDKIHLLQMNALTNKEYEEIEKFLSLIEKEKVFVIEKIKKEFEALIETARNLILNTHHSIVSAMVRRKGSYRDFDFLSLLRVHMNNYVSLIFEKLEEKIDWNSIFIDEKIKNNLQKEIKNFFLEKKEDLSDAIFEYSQSLKQKELFWKTLQERWGKGLGYKEDVARMIYLDKDFRNYQKIIEDKILNIDIRILIHNFIPLPKEIRSELCL